MKILREPEADYDKLLKEEFFHLNKARDKRMKS